MSAKNRVLTYAQRLYEDRGFLSSGREKEDLGEWIYHYERPL